MCFIRGDPIMETCDMEVIILNGIGYFNLVDVDEGSGDCNHAFWVYVRVAQMGGSPIPVEMLVVVNSGGANTTILIDANHDVYVDGSLVGVPYNDGDISVVEDNLFKKIELDDCGKFAFWVNSPMSKGVITLSSDLSGNVGGLCGDFNGIKDDLRLRDGTPDGDFNDISDSYRSDVPNKK